MGSSVHKPFAWVSSAIIVCCSTLYSGLAEAVQGQPAAQLETTSVEVSLSSQLRLTPKDRRTLHVLIECKSDELLSLYEYYSDQEGLDFLGLWNAIRARQTQVVKLPSGRLTLVQERALSIARLDLDSRILDQWLDDYLDQLYEHLELDLVQFKQVQKIFEIEHQQRLEVLREEASRRVRLDEPWRKLSLDRELKLERVLSEAQLRYYRQLTDMPGFIALGLTHKNHQQGS